MSLIKWHPFEKLDEMLHLHWDLAADVYEDDINVYVNMHTPGINPDKVDLEVDGRQLTVSGSREEKEEVKKANYFKKEIKRGSFTRTIDLPCHVDEANAIAETKDGELKIILPKKKKNGEKTHKIKVTKK